MAENTKQPVFKRKLKNYLINRHDQLRIVLMTLIYMSLIAIVTLAIVLYPLISDIFFAQDMGIQYRASQAFLVLINRLVPTVIIMFILIAFHQIIITHRIWGPLVNFTNTVKKIGDGDLTRKIVLRKKDYLKEECRQINVMIDGLIRLVSNVRTSHSKLISALEEVVVIPIVKI